LLLKGEGTLVGRRACEDPVAIGVDGEGQAVGLRDLLEEQQIAGGIFLRAEDGAQDHTGGVVDGMEEGAPRAALFKPGVGAAVHLGEHPGLRETVPAPAMRGASAGAWATDPLRGEEPVDGGPGEDQAFTFGEEFAQVLKVDPGVQGAGELDDPSADGSGHAPGRRAASVPMGQGEGPVLPIGGPQALGLTDRSPQESGGFSHLELAALQGVEDHELLGLPLRQGHHASRLRGGRGVTFSLNA
jgi:hypothetical protein